MTATNNAHLKKNICNWNKELNYGALLLLQAPNLFDYGGSSCRQINNLPLKSKLVRDCRHSNATANLLHIRDPSCVLLSLSRDSKISQDNKNITIIKLKQQIGLMSTVSRNPNSET